MRPIRHGIAILCCAVSLQGAAFAANNTAPTAKGSVKFADPAATDETAARLIELHLKSRGGADQLRAVKSWKLTGTIKEGQREYELTEYFEAPNKYRRELRRDELGWKHLTIEATNGLIAWSQEIEPDTKPARTLEKDEATRLMPSQLPYMALMNPNAPGKSFHYVGEVKAAGSPAYLVRGDLPGGQKLFYYFDKEHYLVRDIGYSEYFGGRSTEMDRFPLRWQTVQGLRIETAYEVRNKGQLLRTVRYNSIQINPDLSDELFEMPRFREVWLTQAPAGKAKLEHRPPLPEELVGADNTLIQATVQ